MPESCGEQLKKYIIGGFIVLFLMNVAGFFVIYRLVEKKMYHSFHLNNGVLEKIHNIRIDKYGNVEKL